MQDRQRAYAIFSITSFACAVGVTLLASVHVPGVGSPWRLVVWFSIFTSLTELLSVNMGDGQQSTISPASPILWAGACIIGPIPTMIMCLVSSILAGIIRRTSYLIAKSEEINAAAGWGKLRDKLPGTALKRISDRLIKVLSSIDTSWQPPSFTANILVILETASALIFIAALPSALYYHLGGHFLADASPKLNVWPSFAAPFVGMAAISICLEHSHYLVAVAVTNPVFGVRGISGAILRAKLVLIENVLPMLKGQLFLVVVAFLLSFLYAHIRIIGFVFAAFPVLALRDFFTQWVQERDAYFNTITTLATYMQHYHPYTRGHLKRVADMSERLARELKLPAESIRHINTAGLLHDIGKIGVSEAILDKTEKLTDEEWATIKEHPVNGAEIISHIEFLDGIVDWIKYHHKWYNGQGYPDTNGNGTRIPIEAAIIATSDAFDAMTDDRELTLDWTCDSCGHKPEDGKRPEVCPSCGAAKRRTYREPKSLDDAIDELRRGAGTQFDPKVVKAFLTMVERDGIHLNV